MIKKIKLYNHIVKYITRVSVQANLFSIKSPLCEKSLLFAHQI